MAILYTVTATLSPGLSILDVQAVLAPAVSWYRIAQNSWVIASWEPAETWWARLRPLVHPSGRIFICRLVPTDKQGWMDQPFWDWMNLHGT